MTRGKDDRERATKFRKELLSGTTSLVLLGLLEDADRSMYGYEIARHVDGLSGDLELRAGALYPALRAMERQGLLRSSIRPSSHGPPRKYYGITAKGRRALQARLTTWRAVRDLVDAVCPDAPPRRRVPESPA